MKAARIVFIVLGWFCITINALGYPSAIIRHAAIFNHKSVAYIIGFNLWFIVGFVFLFIAGRYKRKIARAKEKEMVDSFLLESQS